MITWLDGNLNLIILLPSRLYHHKMILQLTVFNSGVENQIYFDGSLLKWQTQSRWYLVPLTAVLHWSTCRSNSSDAYGLIRSYGYSSFANYCIFEYINVWSRDRHDLMKVLSVLWYFQTGEAVVFYCNINFLQFCTTF